MRVLLLLCLAVAGCAKPLTQTAPPARDPLSEPDLVAAVNALVAIPTADYDPSNPYPGPAAVEAVMERTREGGDALRVSALAGIGDPDPGRRMRASLVLQAHPVSDAELGRLAQSPNLAARMWAVLATDGFPRAEKPLDMARPIPAAEAQRVLSQQASAFERLFREDEANFGGFSQDYLEEYRTRIGPLLARPLDLTRELEAIGADASGDGADDVILVGRLDSAFEPYRFVLIVDGASGTVLVEAALDGRPAARGPRCVDLTGDGRAEVLLWSNIGNPVNEVLHVAVPGDAAPRRFCGREVTVIRDAATGALWVVETSPFNASGGTSTMLLSSYGDQHQLTRLAPGLATAEVLLVYTATHRER